MPTVILKFPWCNCSLVFLACVFSAVGLNGCSRGSGDVQDVVQKTDHSSSEVKEKFLNSDGLFGIVWPPRKLDRPSSEFDQALLQGALSVFESESDQPGTFRLHVTLRRPESDADRIRWNKNLAFPQYAWMASVRVWDRDGIWLWPNLPYLLKAHGEERIERYGGVDPGKGIDNDFAAVLIRPLDVDSTQSPALPLVSADWYAASMDSKNRDKHDRHSIVHVARSDEFSIRVLPDNLASRSGRLAVWLIYADFLGASLPRSWPRKGEYDGGILAYLELSWRRSEEGRFEFDTEHLVPPTDTGFDWAGWSTSSSPLEKNLEMAVPSQGHESENH